MLQFLYHRSIAIRARKDQFSVLTSKCIKIWAGLDWLSEFQMFTITKQNHENVRYTGQGKAQHTKHKRLKFGGGNV
jgi:hypothetical protein